MNTKLWLKYPKLEHQLQLTSDEIVNELQCLLENGHQDLFEMTKNIATGSGKMLRPALVFIFNQMGPSPKNTDEVLPVASSMELLHLATLIHDDVIDDAAIRRHVTTINQKYGMRNAVYTGDFLFTIFFELQTRIDLPAGLQHQNALAMKKILFGELDQMKSNWNFDITLADYLEEVIGKTAVLFAISCQNGIAIAGGNQAEQDAAYNFGLNLGIAFQMMDDLQDFKRVDESGKTNFADVKNGVFSLPYIMAFQADQEQQLQLAIENFDEKKATQIIDLIERYHGFELTKAEIIKYIGLARKEISNFKDEKSVKILNQIIDEIFSRI